MKLRVLQIGAIAVVLAASTYRGFDLDRFLVPKELALHATALLAGIFALRAMARLAFTWIDWLLVAYVALSGISAVFATNRWLGLRALAVTASAVLVFWIARSLPSRHVLLATIAFAVVVACVTSLLQAYGLELDVFALNRAPGGTLGNRNFIGHMAAFGLPVVLLVAFRASTFLGQVLAFVQIAIVTASLVLTRSRAAWLAAAVVVLIFVVAMTIAAPLRRMWVRFGLLVIVAGIAVIAALLIPNTLRWRSDNPYLESVRSVASYDEGSGRGRLIQYERSLRMAAAHPLFGVGPGNWPVEYPKHAARRDPSLDPSEPGVTFNPWPSSDWIAIVAERGFVAAIVIAFAFVAMFVSAFRQLFVTERAEEAMALLGTLAGVAVTGAFDAVLLLAAPALIVWTILGALHPPMPIDAAPRTMPVLFAIAFLLVAAAGAFRSGSQLVAMDLYSRGSLERAARIDPANYRARLRLAQIGKRKQRCGHARAAYALFPNADAARDVASACGAR